MTAVILAAPFAAAGQASEVASTPLVAASQADTGYSLEVAGSYRWAGRSLLKGIKASLHGTFCGPAPQREADVQGIDITLVKRLSEHHAVDLRLGYSTGSFCATLGPEDIAALGASQYIKNLAGFHAEARVHNISFMPGYRFTYGVTPKTALFVGANVGLVDTTVKCSLNKYGESSQYPYAANPHDTAFGFGYSAEAGVRYALADNVEVFAAYEFLGNTAAPKLKGAMSNGSTVNATAEVTVKKQVYHGIRAGISYRF